MLRGYSYNPWWLHLGYHLVIGIGPGLPAYKTCIHPFDLHLYVFLKIFGSKGKPSISVSFDLYL